MKEQEFAFIAKAYQQQNIQWIRLSPDDENTGGLFLLLYSDLSKGSLYDYWFENIFSAKEWAKKYYGIQEIDWKNRESLEMDGIAIIDEK